MNHRPELLNVITVGKGEGYNTICKLSFWHQVGTCKNKLLGENQNLQISIDPYLNPKSWDKLLKMPQKPKNKDSEGNRLI